MTKKKSDSVGVARDKHIKTKATSTVVKFVTKEGKTVEVKGIKTQKTNPVKKKK